MKWAAFLIAGSSIGTPHSRSVRAVRHVRPPSCEPVQLPLSVWLLRSACTPRSTALSMSSLATPGGGAAVTADARTTAAANAAAPAFSIVVMTAPHPKERAMQLGLYSIPVLPRRAILSAAGAANGAYGAVAPLKTPARSNRLTLTAY